MRSAGILEEKIASIESLHTALEAQRAMLKTHEEALTEALGPKLALLRVAA